MNTLSINSNSIFDNILDTSWPPLGYNIRCGSPWTEDKDGNYKLSEILVQDIELELIVKNAIGKVRIDIDPLESIILRLIE